MILTDKGRMLLTPTYHVFHMYKPFRGATHLPVELVAPQHKMGETSAPTLTVSAARGSDGGLHIALVNLHPREALTGAIRIPGATPKKFSGTILTASAMDAHNTFDSPESVKPAAFKGARVQQGLVHVEVPAKSIVVLSETAK
jgi:alpha-N-arabinofuranosidase